MYLLWRNFYLVKDILKGGLPGSLVVKNLPAMEETRVPAMQETWVRSSQDPLEEGMATHSSILAWKTPWREEPGGLYSPWGHAESDTTEVLLTAAADP